MHENLIAERLRSVTVGCGTTVVVTGRPTEGSEVRASEVVRAYETDQQRRGLSPSTIRRRSYTLWCFELWLRPRCLLDADEDDVQAWLDSRQGLDGGRLHPRARYCYLSNLGCFFKFAVKLGQIATDPTSGIARPKLPKNKPRPFADDDLTLALEMATPTLRVLIALGAFAGFRCLEMARLQREDIWEQTDEILARGKGDKERVVPLHPYLWMALRSLGLPRWGHVLRRENGDPWTAMQVSQTGNRYFRDLGIDATMHQLRHRFATQVYRASGGDVLCTRDLLGHESLASTMVYAAFHQPKARQAVEALTLPDGYQLSTRGARPPPPAVGSAPEEADPELHWSPNQHDKPETT